MVTCRTSIIEKWRLLFSSAAHLFHHLSFRQAFARADAMAAGRLEEYEKAHRRLRRPSALMSWLMLTVGGQRRLRRCVLDALATYPKVLSFALAAHTDLLPITAVPLRSMAGFVGRLLIGSASKTKSGVSEVVLEAVPASIASVRE